MSQRAGFASRASQRRDPFFPLSGVGIVGCIIFGWLFSRMLPEPPVRVRVFEVTSADGVDQ